MNRGGLNTVEYYKDICHDIIQVRINYLHANVCEGLLITII